MLLVTKSLNTSGDGLWSNVAKSVKVTGLELDYVNEEGDFGELRVYFDTQSWNVNEDGLVYTDVNFLEELKNFLAEQNLGTDVYYSEQGMQGDNYVSLDCEIKFINSFKSLITVTV